MRLSRRDRRLLLVTHVVTSVGWLGVAYATLVMVIVAMTSDDAATRQGSYALLLAFDSAAVLPLGLLALLTGLLLGWGTHWGVLRHWWVALKLVGNLVVLVAPLLARRPNVQAALDAVRSGAPDGPIVVHILPPSIATVLVLTLATVLSVYRPWGRTPWARVPAAGAPGQGTRVARSPQLR
jgi:hypothetical protein